MKTANGYEVIELFEQFSPKKYAMEGDPIGLHIGSLHKPVSKVMIALDVLEEVVDEAIENRVELIIAHHPLIYRPLKKIDTTTATGRVVEKLIKHDIAVYAAHTNLDVTKGGVNDLLAEALHLKDTEVLVPTHEIALKKVVVFVPVAAENQVREALAKAGAGAIGPYSNCSFTAKGTGRFLPEGGSEPAIGTLGQLEVVSEVRIETIFPENIEKKVLSAMIKAHPYEEVAYDLYRLDNSGEVLGLGKIGSLAEEMTLAAFAEHVKQTLAVDCVRVVGDLEAKVKKVAVLGGDGNKYFTTAKFKGADVYVTGDIYYHTAHDAMMLGLNMVDPGHHVEKVMKQGVATILADMCRERKLAVEFVASTLNTDPFMFV